MPRKRKTISGADAAPARPAVGVPYGEGERRLESQRRTPLPAGPPPSPGAGSTGGISSGPGSGPPGPGSQQMRMLAALQAAQGMKPPTSVFSATERPAEPLSTGLPIGPGAGPEIIRSGDRVAQTFRLLADVTGDPRFEDLADLAARSAH